MTSPAPIRAEIAAFLENDTGPGLETLDPAVAREGAKQGQCDLPVGEIALVQDIHKSGANGGITARLYDPRENREPSPVLVFFHGGGWVLNDVDMYDPVCAEIARHLAMPVISVEYRLAPEHPWPAAPDDCEAATRWIAEAPSCLGFKPTSLVLAGDSAGGNLAIVTALALRDNPASLPVMAHWAIYPVTNLDGEYPWATRYANGHYLTAAGMDWFRNHYQADTTHWRASPIKTDLKALPPALVTVAECDVLVDQGRAYTERLRAAGVAVQHIEAKGNIHGFINHRGSNPSSAKDFSASLDVLKTMITF